MDNIGGAEMVTLSLAEHLNADVYSCVANQENIKKMGFSVKVKTISPIPLKPPLRQQMAAHNFKKLKLKDKYDFYIIAGDWAITGAVHNKPNLWYVHAPKRELWDLYEYTREHLVPDGKHIKNFNRYVFDVWVRYNRWVDKKYIKHIEQLACNSKTVQARIKKYLKRDAVVIYPPTDTRKFAYKTTGDYWLSVNRTIKTKRIELQTGAFKQLPDEKLIIVATYEDAEHFLEYRKTITDTKPDNVTLVSHVSFDELTDLYANCKGFITTAKDEDFGLTAVEAMASGKPVIAPNEGGYSETIVHGKTGLLIDAISVEKIVDAIKEINRNPAAYKDACIKRAQLFDTRVFIEAIKKQIGYGA